MSTKWVMVTMFQFESLSGMKAYVCQGRDIMVRLAKFIPSWIVEDVWVGMTLIISHERS